MKNGFTLVELSIVLVIIGLLIGGILVGQSLIESAKTQSYIRKIQQFEIAYDLFKDKFRQLPGDTNLLPAPGNNNGDIDDGSNICNGNYTRLEAGNSMAHLSIAGMINEPLSLFDLTGCGTGTAAFEAHPYIFSANAHLPGLGFESARWQEYLSGQNIEAGVLFGNNQIAGVFPPSDRMALISALDVFSTLAVDRKLDDGDSTTGDFLAAPTPSLSSGCETAIDVADSEVCFFEHRWNR